MTTYYNGDKRKKINPKERNNDRNREDAIRIGLEKKQLLTDLRVKLAENPEFRLNHVNTLISKGELNQALSTILQYQLQDKISFDHVFSTIKPTPSKAVQAIYDHKLQLQYNPVYYLKKLAKEDPSQGLLYYNRLQMDTYYPGEIDPIELITIMVEKGLLGKVLMNVGKDLHQQSHLLSLLQSKDLRLAQLHASSMTISTDESRSLLSNRLSLPTHLEPMVVDDLDMITKARSLLLDNNVTRIGLDTETQPCFRKGQVRPTSLLQVSSDSDVFLLDLLTCMGPEMASLIGDLLSSPTILKIGLDLSRDIRDLRHSYPEYLSQWNMVNFLDVNAIFKDVYGGAFRPQSLKKLCAYAYGATMSKQQQMSNWGQRPLTGGQRDYAGLDAWCVLGIVDKLQEAMESTGRVFDITKYTAQVCAQ